MGYNKTAMYQTVMHTHKQNKFTLHCASREPVTNSGLKRTAWF